MKNLIQFVLFSLLTLSWTPKNAAADVGGLNPCSSSEVFQKRLTKSIKKLEFRLKKYEEASPPRIAIEQQIAQTKQRFTRYAESGLLC